MTRRLTDLPKIRHGRSIQIPSPADIIFATVQNSMPLQLQFVQTIEEIRDSLHTFNAEARVHPDLTNSLLTQTTYWIYDRDTKAFGPSKVVGLRDMNIQDYGSARAGKRLGVPFDGGQTRIKIEKLLGEEFVPNAKMATALEAWAATIVAPDAADHVFDGVDKS